MWPKCAFGDQRCLIRNKDMPFGNPCIREMGRIGRLGVSPDVVQQLREEIRIRTEQNKHTPVLQSCKRAIEINKELFGPSNPGFQRRITASKKWYRTRVVWHPSGLYSYGMGQGYIVMHDMT